MNAEIEHKAKKSAIIVFFVGLVLTIFFSVIEKDSSDILGGLAVTFIVSTIVFYITESVMKNKVQFTTAQWAFYVFGWIIGIGNLLFWLIMYAAYLANNYGDSFFNKDFHRRVVIWGKVWAVIFLVTLIILLIVAGFLGFT